MTARSAPVSVAATRKMMWRMLGADHPMAAHRVDSRAIATRGRSADVREGIASFFDRRDPEFTDRVSDGFGAIFEEWNDPTFDS
jgi:enoyl-CoA hydratase/carnithine racemase